ncbi:transglutaminase domain-containing protein [Candidatus Gracilibacteria bacterium]|nr:transglutaminase domain-containing protein [Candidatus Gracilibacteria bacterium]
MSRFFHIFLRVFILVYIGLSVFFSAISVSYAATDSAEKVSELIKNYVEKKYKIVDHFPVYSAIRTRISELLVATPDSQFARKIFLSDIMFYNNNNIYALVQYVASREGALNRFTMWKSDGNTELLSFEKSLRVNKAVIPEAIVLNESFEFSKNSEIYRLNFESIAVLDASQIQSFQLPSNHTLYYSESIGYFVPKNPSLEKKISFVDFLVHGPKKFFLYNSSYYEENGIFYTYGYDTYFDTFDSYGLYASDWKKLGYNLDDGVILRLQDAKNTITFSPRPVKIIPKSYLDQYGPIDKQLVNEFATDALRIEKDYSRTYQAIFKKAHELTDGLETDDEKIRAVYDWIKINIEYTKLFYESDPRIFSGLETFESKNGVCEGQVRLMSYMLKIAGIEDVRIKLGYVIDSKDFPRVGHSWIQIGNDFYDPTFEPSYQKDVSDYMYYKLPYDVMYTNRYNIRDMPKEYFNISKEVLAKEVNMKRRELTKRYPQSIGFKVLEKAHFQVKNGLIVDGNILLGEVINLMKEEQVYYNNNKVSTLIEGVGKELEYYPIPTLETDVESVLMEVNYDISKLRLFKIYKEGVFYVYGLYEK